MTEKSKERITLVKYAEFGKKVFGRMEEDYFSSESFLESLQLAKIAFECGLNNEREAESGWIKGSSPQYSGWYELTLGFDIVIIDYFSKEEWEHDYSCKVLAYKPLILSTPFVEQRDDVVSERVCPFCGEGRCSLGSKRGFICLHCDSRIPSIKTEKELKELDEKYNSPEVK